MTLECKLINHPTFLFVQITTEKLDELKGNIPRAGPKYRLGMYFETIHGVSDFEDVYTPSEDGYTSYWETDTEVDTELGNLIFTDVTGDSASVICIDEAVDILTLREQRLQEQALRQERARAAQELNQQEEHVLERSTESKRSMASRQSRRSHNSGSDGMYDEPPPLPPRRISTCTETTGTSAEEHTYETLDDFQDEYKMHTERGSGSPMNKDECDSDQSSGKGRTRSPLLNFTKARSNSIPTSTNDSSHQRHRRKVSDPLHIADFTQKRKRSDKVSPKGTYPPPVKGYSIPLGIPEEYPDYMTIPSEKRLQAAPPTSPNRHAPERRLDNRKSSKLQRSPSLIIKHKGQTFMIPVVDKKLQQRLEKVKGPPKTSPLYATVMKQSMHNNLTRATSDPYNRHSGRHISPPKETQELSKSKSTKRHSQPNATSKQVTHYGVL